MKKKREELVCADWKDSDELLSNLKDALKKFGLEMYDSPAAEGSDLISFWIANYKMSERELAKMEEEFLDW